MNSKYPGWSPASRVIAYLLSFLTGAVLLYQIISFLTS